MDKQLDVTIKKSEDEQRIVWAEVYIPNVPDTDGDYMDAKGIRDMAYKFMKELRLKKVDTQHNNQLVEGATVVESFIARKGDPDFIEGAWVAGVHVPDDLTWGKIKKGEINGFSMEAIVNKKPLEIEVDIPPVLTGPCLKADDGHTHEYMVSYDPKGNFLGGKTTMNNGHYHTIKRGTLTDEVNGHTHKFDYSKAISTINSVES